LTLTAFDVLREGEATKTGHQVLQTTTNLITGERDFEGEFGDISTLESNLLLLASSIFAADRAAKRGEREDYGRSIALQVPIVNVGRIAPAASRIESLLRRLSHDSWHLHFRQVQGTPEPSGTEASDNGAVLLFSGGLDSFAGAIESLRKGGPLHLVSHVTMNRQTREAQQNLVDRLEQAGFAFDHTRFFVSSRNGGPTALVHDVESSQRTRSFLFLTLAALVARRHGYSQLVMIAENGQFAIHLPLSSARIGAFSTRTADPEFLSGMQAFLSEVLEFNLKIVNPFVYQTKGEVTKRVIDALPQALPVTSSCWKNSRLGAGVTHCGECIPCMMRRISIECHRADPTAYARDVWSENLSRADRADEGPRKLIDLSEFIFRVQASSNEDLMSEFPEL